ncbi:MAG: phosphotransferase [Bifidobacteriaceae bacterium]|nr:phosphotransferase [Bifidobacteriaceae bacterium]
MSVSLMDQLAEPSLSAFDHLTRGAPAPYWLYRGVCANWGLEHDRVDLTLITVSENATFLLALDGQPIGAVRVSHPGYVGGPSAINSEIAWINAIRLQVDEVRVLTVVPSPRGNYVCVIKDNAGTGWICVSTKFVPGTVLEDLPDPSAYYETIGRWSALLHKHARSWELPYGFRRFAWDTSDIVGPSARWGRWEASKLTTQEAALLGAAQFKALQVMSGYPKNGYTWGLIHADLRASNVLAEGDQLTVIDFDDSGFGYYLWDYAAALSFLTQEPYGPAMAQAWIRGYTQITGLDDKEIEVASALTMLRKLQLLGWLCHHREDALPPGLAAAQTAGAVVVAERYLEASTWLLD